ncbi:transporter substrate-binding domain-containing protein [Fulvimarina sp. 2208YS6-2-32]|uniref:Transporter substrate-binding domain-containing protein n=1 Tax=Fulvimarina uroteuthidis TaxID=3098149 RepID=A0ABU5I3P1_9HYPH|nr:transporter substrate-binding domain-containing protein [Fulvimarina sp. 2208YS6-2-32]MDY8109578.1 transporter substrate-binding domain-containing protein [Fulvimarina sp. 2208YS6-2-32]
MFVTTLLLTIGSVAGAQEPALPSFIDQKQRLTAPELPNLTRLRFLTATDYPPFNFLDQRGRLVGFNVDLTRALCEELDILRLCQVEAVPFSDLEEALASGRGEAVIAGLAISPQSRNQFAFTQSYLRFPARFVTLKEAALQTPVAENLGGKTVGVLQGSAHEAMFRAFFPDVEPRAFPDRNAALDALKEGEIDAYFGDGVSLSFWLESDRAEGCCAFSDGPFLSDQYLGEGLSIAVAAKDARLARALDYALVQTVEKGIFSELLLRYFPVSPW